VTGFLNTAQQEVLLKDAAPALSKHDEQKKAEEEAEGTTCYRCAYTGFYGCVVGAIGWAVARDLRMQRRK